MAEIDPTAAIEHPADHDPKQGGVLGFFNGVGDVIDSIQGITSTGAEIAGDIADGRAAIHDEQHDRRRNAQDLFLEKYKTMRGDNKLMYLAVAAAAVAVVVIVVK